MTRRSLTACVGCSDKDGTIVALEDERDKLKEELERQRHEFIAREVALRKEFVAKEVALREELEAAKALNEERPSDDYRPDQSVDDLLAHETVGAVKRYTNPRLHRFGMRLMVDSMIPADSIPKMLNILRDEFSISAWTDMSIPSDWY